MLKNFRVLAVFALIACAAVHAAVEEEDLAEEGATQSGSAKAGDVDEKDVLVLTNDNFDDAVKNNKHMLVEFYAPWCGHCKSLKKPYAEAATLAKQLDPPVALAKVDATKEEALGTKYEVQGFPTLKFFSEGEVIDYNGGRDAEQIVAWVKKMSGSPTQQIADEAALSAFLEANPVGVVSFFASREGDRFNGFKKAAMKSRKPFAEAPAALAASKNAKEGDIVLFKKFDEGQVTYTSTNNTAEAILDFVATSGRPSVFDFKEELIEDMFGNNLPKLCLFAATADTRAAFEAAAKNVDLRGNAIFIVVPKDADPNFFEFMGVQSTQETPLVVEINASNGKKYRHAGDITTDAIVQFFRDVAADKVKPHLKSAPKPEQNDGPVVEVVGETFKEIVLDSDKHVIVEFYAPWCGHCKQLTPIYEKVAQHFKDSNPDDIIIAKIDGTANEVADPELDVQGFPTIFAFPKGDKKNPVDISSKRGKNAKSFIAAISKAVGLDSNRPGEAAYRDAVARLKVVLKQRPALLPFVAEELTKVAQAAETKAAEAAASDPAPPVHAAEGKTEL